MPGTGALGLRAVAALLLSVGLALVGAGALTTTVSLRLTQAGTAPAVVGAVATAYFLGLTLGAMRAHRLIRQVGHIRAFAAFAATLSAAALSYALWPPNPGWGLVRLLDGFCMAGVFVCIESWLNDRATAANRGRLLAAYMVCTYAAQALGQGLLGLGAGERLFILVAMPLCLAVLPVGLTRLAPPALPEVRSLGLRRLHAVSPLGVVGTVASGLLLGAVYGLGPVFAREAVGPAGAAGFMALLIGSGMLLQWPLGWLSDRFDRRRVILGVMAGLVLASGAMLLAAPRGGTALLAAGVAFGGVVFAIYPLCAAHTNDWLSAGERVPASGGLILAYSFGAVAGPLLGAAAMTALGGRGLFAFTGAVGLACLGFGLRRLLARPPVPEDRQQPFQPMPGTTPAAATLRPHAERP